ncbi:unnamed protein product [Darwinula stevensoni]|uniref:Reticulon-like protein n=1 Tax=Darwinula stevensoni TaxID=69355 RepID=A0A7R8X0N6_9CRUS|nr:unnamed protein product [Darwinula stevensoni]CAG0879384.1 unnamed protein product [Darwinula stevensoni]
MADPLLHFEYEGENAEEQELHSSATDDGSNASNRNSFADDFEKLDSEISHPITSLHLQVGDMGNADVAEYGDEDIHSPNRDGYSRQREDSELGEGESSPPDDLIAPESIGPERLVQEPPVFILPGEEGAEGDDNDYMTGRDYDVEDDLVQVGKDMASSVGVNEPHIDYGRAQEPALYDRHEYMGEIEGSHSYHEEGVETGMEDSFTRTFSPESKGTSFPQKEEHLDLEQHDLFDPSEMLGNVEKNHPFEAEEEDAGFIPPTPTVHEVVKHEEAPLQFSQGREDEVQEPLLDFSHQLEPAGEQGMEPISMQGLVDSRTIQGLLVAAEEETFLQPKMSQHIEESQTHLEDLAGVGEMKPSRQEEEGGVRTIVPDLSPPSTPGPTPPPRDYTPEPRSRKAMSSKPTVSSPTSSKASLSYNPLLNLIYWRDVKKSGVVFGGGLVVLISLVYFSLISVLSYSSLVCLLGAGCFRIYKWVLAALHKTQADSPSHPFQEWLEEDIEVSEEKAKEFSILAAQRLNKWADRLRRLFLIDNIFESIKFALLLWGLTYIGAWFNGLTLIILGYAGIFTIPKVYEVYQVQIDQYLNLVRDHVSAAYSKVKGMLPGGAGKEAEKPKAQ